MNSMKKLASSGFLPLILLEVVYFLTLVLARVFISYL